MALRLHFADSRQGNFMNVNTGISETSRKTIANELSKLLADTYTLYLKTQNFHWNVTGQLFQQLHSMFEQQYTELALAVDIIAERIRSLGFQAPASYREFSKLTSISDAEGPLNSREMIHQLIEGHETISRTTRSAFMSIDRLHDEASIDLFTERMRTHEKMAWMLRSLLEG